MGRRDQDPRPPIELWGESSAPEADEAVVQVGAGTRRGRPLLVALALGALLFVGLGLDPGGDDPSTSDAAQEDEAREGDEEPERRERRELKEATSTTRRRLPRTTTTTAPAVPILPGAGVHALLVGGQRGAELLDLATGFSESVDLRRDVWDLVPVARGVVLVEAGMATYWELPGDEPVELGVAERVLAGPDPETVWLVRELDGSYSPRAYLLRLDGSVIAGPVTIEQGWIIGSSARGLFAQSGGRVFELRTDGTVVPVVVGDALGVSQARLIVRVCDDLARCHVEVVGEDLTRSGPLDAPSHVGWYGSSFVFSPAGDELAMLRWGPSGSTLALVPLDGRRYRVLEQVSDPSDVAWLPGDLGLLVVKRSELLHVYERAGKTVVRSLRRGGADRVAVIPR